MKKPISCLLLAFIVIFIPLFASQPQQGAKGHKLVERYKKIAKARKKQGYGQSALSGAKSGAVKGLGAAGSRMAAIAVTQAMKGNSAQSVDFKNMIIIPTVAATLGSAGVGTLMSMWNEAFYRNSTPEWIVQLKLLANNKDSISDDTVLYLGVPSVDQPIKKGWFGGANKLAPKAYLVSSTFDNITNALNDNHYELYLMPKDFCLMDVFFSTNNFLSKEASLKNYVAFVALRPTPGVTKSPYNSKNMPRIIIGFTPGTKSSDVEKVITDLDLHLRRTIKHYPPWSLDILNSSVGINIQPRYSQKIDRLMYLDYGSPDFKDSEAGQTKYADKRKGLWFWQKPSDEAMAYPSPASNYITKFSGFERQR